MLNGTLGAVTRGQPGVRPGRPCLPLGRGPPFPAPSGAAPSGPRGARTVRVCFINPSRCNDS